MSLVYSEMSDFFHHIFDVFSLFALCFTMHRLTGKKKSLYSVGMLHSDLSYKCLIEMLPLKSAKSVVVCRVDAFNGILHGIITIHVIGYCDFFSCLQGCLNGSVGINAYQFACLSVFCNAPCIGFLVEVQLGGLSV